MRVITFDIETSNTFDDVGSQDPADLDLAVICIHDSETNEFSSYFKEDLNKLWPIIEKADALVGWNSDHFDIPLLNKYYVKDHVKSGNHTASLTKIKSVDLMNELKKTAGRRIKLDYVAQGSLGEAKSANGLQSIIWWRNGEKEKVVDYCIQDVKVTRNIYDYAIKNQSLKFIKDGATEEFPVDTSNWEKKDEVPDEPPTLSLF